MAVTVTSIFNYWSSPLLCNKLLIITTFCTHSSSNMIYSYMHVIIQSLRCIRTHQLAMYTVEIKPSNQDKSTYQLSLTVTWCRVCRAMPDLRALRAPTEIAASLALAARTVPTEILVWASRSSCSRRSRLLKRTAPRFSDLCVASF